MLRSTWLSAAKQSLHQRLVADVAAHELVAPGALGLLYVALEVLEVARVGEQVEVDDARAKGGVVQTGTDERAADEAGATGDEEAARGAWRGKDLGLRRAHGFSVATSR
jgi:hypothetical protein